jgi:transcriptional regulator with XRE-family HTH domain
MSFAAHIAWKPAPADGREAARYELRLPSEVAGAEGATSPVLIHNLSATGLLLETDLDLMLGDRLIVGLPELGEVPAEVVWRSEDLVGCRFLDPLPGTALSAARLRDDSHVFNAAVAGELDDLGNRLRVARERLGLSRADLAARVGLSVPTLWAWERGKTQPRGKNLRLVTQLLNLTAEDLGLGERPADPVEGHAGSLAISTPGEGPAAEIERLKAQIAQALDIEESQIEIVIRW